MDTEEARSNNSALSIRFDSGVYDLDTVKRAAYRFIDRYAFDFALDDGDIVCLLTSLTSAADITDITSAFRNEVLDQDLRRRIAEETAPIRNAILAYAFSQSGLQPSE